MDIFAAACEFAERNSSARLKGTVRQQRQTISFIVPFCDEAMCLPTLLKALNTFIVDVERKRSVRADVIFVDDGSRDGSCDVLRAAVRAQEPRFNVRVIRLSRNFGKEAALTIGLNAANADAVVLMDADLQHPLELVDGFLDGWLNEGFDVVYGYKDVDDESWTAATRAPLVLPRDQPAHRRRDSAERRRLPVVDAPRVRSVAGAAGAATADERAL